MLYKKILKPILFRFDPEHVHDAFTLLGQALGMTHAGRLVTSYFCNFAHPALEQTLLGISFKNPIGLSAGFDKNGLLTDILPSVGFGFEEIGSVTGEPCQGNAKPRLWRLPKSQGLIVNYGLKNDGCQKIATRLEKKTHCFPLGISIAKTNIQETVDTHQAISDYEKAFRTLNNLSDYITINISCPNTFGGEPFTTPERLDLLLTRLDAIPTNKPIFIKLPVDIPIPDLDALTDVILRHRVQGVITANLTKKRDRKEIQKEEAPPEKKGGISGKPTFHASNHLIAHLFTRVGDRLIIIGSGGVFTAEDAYEKITCGASLVQLITGMIFEGPQLIKKINKGLVVLLKKDGFANIHEAVGKKASAYLA